MLLHLYFLLPHVALHSHNVLLHAAIVLVDLLHPVSFHPELFDLLSELIILLFDSLALLHRLVKVSQKLVGLVLLLV